MKTSRSLLCLVLVSFAVGGCTGKSTGNGGGGNGDDSSGDSITGGDAGPGDAMTGDTTAGDAQGGDGMAGGDGGTTVTMNCSSCHGGADNAAPPLGLGAVSDANDARVGAHQAHVAGGAWHRAVACVECHLVPVNVDDTGHIDTLPPAELTWRFPANAAGAIPIYDFVTTSCSDVYCHGVTLKPANPGGSVARTPDWTVVDGTFSACGSSCHTNPPAPPHSTSDFCEGCHGAVIAAYDPINPAASTWTDASLHIDGAISALGMSCTSCHGTPGTGEPNPPRGTANEMLTTEAAVGAHVDHLTTGNGWHREVICTDCHVVPASSNHSNGLLDLPWGGPSDADGAMPAYDPSSNVCSNVYCHGGTLYGPVGGGSVNRDPVWTEVNGTWDSCGDTCHTLPPAGSHPAISSGCEACHPAVISSFNATTPSNSTWQDASRHIDGVVDVAGLSCTSCHGDVGSGAVNPPLGTGGETQTTDAAVGAHVEHLASGSGWHADVECIDCHPVVTSPTHSDGTTDMLWDAPANADGASPSYDFTSTTCSNVYCHGTTLYGPIGGGSVSRTPDWTVVDGTYDSCGDTCHTLPPAAPHPAAAACEGCHPAVMRTYNAGTPANSIWEDPTRHIDGVVDVAALDCYSCHGDRGNGHINPPVGSGGETNTTQAAVGAHQDHLQVATTWHRDVVCTDCHVLPSSTAHSDAVTDHTWGGPAIADGASPSYDFSSTTCDNVYCHGTTLRDAKASGSVQRAPDWTQVDGTFDSCGDSCHTNPPGGNHVLYTDCTICHSAVINSFNPGNDTATWTAKSLHVDGIKQSNLYHDLGGWTAPIDGTNHHGSNYFLTNQQQDEHNLDCSQCHGPNLDGGDVNVSCFSGCHGGNLTSCDYCHGNAAASRNSPPDGVGGETGTDTLAVGRHTAHLTAGSSHVAFACDNCHVIPASGDFSHLIEYVPSADLSIAGHHGDVSLSGRAAGMTWDVTDTVGNPVSQRGSCLGACHSNGRGGAPNVTPYWAGGTWVSSCGNCHDASPNTNEHRRHINRGYACTECHPAANSAAHVNGSENVVNNHSGTLTITMDDCSSNTLPRCDGACHGEDHSNDCW